MGDKFLLIWIDIGRKLDPSLVVDPHLPEFDYDQLKILCDFKLNAFQSQRLNVLLRPSNNPEYTLTALPGSVAIVLYQRTPA
jgi:hypothetical protein